MPLITRTVFEVSDLEIRKVDDTGKRTIAGYAVLWDKLSLPIYGSFRERVRSGAFKKSLSENNVRSLWNHNSDMVLGSTKAKTMRLSEDEKGLRFEIDLPETNAGKDAGVMIERGDVDGMSFGFNICKQEWDETDPKNIIRTLIVVDLREISPTPFPAYPQSKVSVRSVEDDFVDHSAEIASAKAEEEKRTQTAQAETTATATTALNILKMKTSTY
jgi:HK97 family phage prohead protease